MGVKGRVKGRTHLLFVVERRLQRGEADREGRGRQGGEGREQRRRGGRAPANHATSHSQHGASESDPLAYSHTHHGLDARTKLSRSPLSRRRFAAEARAARWARLGPPSFALSSPPVGAACADAAAGCVNGVSSRLGLSTGWAADAASRPDIGKVAASLEELAAKLGASASPSTLPPRRHRAGTA